MHAKLIPLIGVILTCGLIANAQSIAFDINGGNPQRTRVLNTKGPETAPSQAVWKSEKLFHYRASDWVMSTRGPFRLSLDVPTQYFTVPIIGGDLLYFTYGATDGYLFAIDRLTGQSVLRLKFDLNRVSRPTAKDNIVFFGSARGGVYAYDARKQEAKWKFEDKHHAFSGAPPLLDGDLLYFHADNRGLYAFVADTGQVKWLFKSERYLYGPAVAGDRVVVLTRMGRMIAVDRETGVKRWDVDVGRHTTYPAVFGERIFLVYDGGQIRSYSAVDGALQWKSKDVPRSGTPVALHNGLVYYAGRGNDVLALDVTNGAEKLRFKTKRKCDGPLIAGELLYVRCHDNKLYALSTSRLEPVWETKNEDQFPPQVLFADGVMYSLGSDGYMYAAR